jgi:shikimate dehydrogenase
MTSGRALFGLVGTNIMKSLSPAMHEDALTALGMTGHYHLIDLDQLPGRKLEAVIAGLRATGFTGFNVTFPFKQTVMPLLDEISVDAQQIGAVNTVTISEHGHLCGYNTDRIGFLRGLEEHLGRAAVQDMTVLLVGAGGAGRAVAFALMDLGASEVAIYDTDRSKVVALIADLMQHFGAARCRMADDLVRAAKVARGIVNATPIGMIGFAGLPVPAEAVQAHHWVADVVYTPLKTELIETAIRRGARTATADGMSVHQAAAAFQLFTGHVPDIARMRATFMAGLAARDRLLSGTVQHPAVVPTQMPTGDRGRA